MKPKVFVARPIPIEVEQYIAEHCEVEKWLGEDTIPRAELLKAVQQVEGLLTTGGRIDGELLDHAPHLKVVSNISVGYNNFDLEAMKARKILGTNTPYVLDNTVADLVMGLILSTARRIPELDQYVKNGQWRRGDDEVLFGVDVHHSTLGIIGLGRIGEAIARRAKLGFDMNVLYHNRSPKTEVEQSLGIRPASLDDLLAQSDFVVLMTPLTPETTHLMGREEFEKMKDTAIFINASRGKTVDEQALIEALETKQIRGAGLDVYEREPIASDHPFLKMPQVVTLPHIGSSTAKTRLDMAKTAAKNLVMAVTGEVPPNVVKELLT
ncbi:D-glycerate dehydrogenase [Ammoniphilus sp. CFH 90114]|uniref:2-hydroxyacid dehydrogenase n=1 Tax=Ammoniphilus sp. CFH 90114 TaxID=2493665 RepID=UPI00100E8DC6|nr:D-glycerate dehydrogenase [Ammoniphilus sp. CFH 90114]RXT05659.1 D-glycerate dehydrogenase [Ammoniphilus sp. CFH 90114]